MIPERFAMAIARVLDEPTFAHEVGIRGRSWVLGRWDPSKYRQRLLAVYGDFEQLAAESKGDFQAPRATVPPSWRSSSPSR